MIDNTKKYKLLGTVLEFTGFGWENEEYYFSTTTMETLVAEGYAVEFVEPMRVEFSPDMPYLLVNYDKYGLCSTGYCPDWASMQLRAAAGGFSAVANKTFSLSLENSKIVATEVIQ